MHTIPHIGLKLDPSIFGDVACVHGQKAVCGGVRFVEVEAAAAAAAAAATAGRRGGAAANQPLVLKVDLVAEDDKREVVWVAGAGLDEELVPPGI